MLIGALLIPAGAGVIVAGAADDSCEKHATGVCAGGGVMVTVGVFALAGGIVMMAIGGRKVPANQSPQAWWIPTPQLTGHAGGLTWTF